MLNSDRYFFEGASIILDFYLDYYVYLIITMHCSWYTLRFTNVTWTTRRISFVNNTQFIIVFISKRRNMSSVQSYSNSETIINELLQCLQKMFWFNFTEFKIEYFHWQGKFGDSNEMVGLWSIHFYNLYPFQTQKVNIFKS